MNVNHLAAGLTSLMMVATTFASPFVARAPLGHGPVDHWFASSYLDTTCGGGAFQNFSGSGGSCNVIEDTHPPADFIVEIQSILIGSMFGNYDFTFLPDTTCDITGIADIIHQIGSGETKCVDISSLEAGSFDVNPVATTLKPRLLPESTWDALFYSSASCEGVKTGSFSGSSSECVLSNGLLKGPLPPAESNSILISANFGNYDFSFFQNEVCEDTGVLELVYTITSGQSLCVDYTDAVSFEVTDITTALKRSPDDFLETKRSLTSPVVARGPGPVAIWNVTTFPDQDCGQDSIQSFEASGIFGCNVISGSEGGEGFALPLFVETGSVLITDSFADFTFSFFDNQACQIGPIIQRVYEVEGEKCISLGSLHPESFTVGVVEGNVKARQGGLEDFWEASAFFSADCTGTVQDSFTGAGSACDVVTPNELNRVASVLISATQNSYDFSFYGNTECQVGSFNQELYPVSAGGSQCVTLPTGLDLLSISVEEL